MGGAVLLGAYEGLTVTLWAARTAKTLGQNRLVLEIQNRDEIEGKAPGGVASQCLH